MTIRLGFVGTGGMGKEHLKALAPIDDVRVVALCDVDTARMAPRVEQLTEIWADTNPALYTNAETMLRDSELDAVFLLLPPFAHGDAERACIKHNKPFFVEKPLGLDMGLTREIAAEVAKTGLLTSTGYMNRYREGVRTARELLRNDPAALITGGWIGGSPNPQPSDGANVSWWVQRNLSGGQIVEQSTHTFDVLRYLCGEAVEVFAYAANGFNKDLFKYTIDDASHVTIKMANGGVANLWSCCAADAGGGGVSLNLYAKRCTLQFTGWEHSVSIRQKGEQTREIAGEGDIFRIEDKVFLNALRTGNGAAIVSTYPDAARTLELTLAANRSIATGKPVAIPMD